MTLVSHKHHNIHSNMTMISATMTPAIGAITTKKQRTAKATNGQHIREIREGEGEYMLNIIEWQTATTTAIAAALSAATTPTTSTKEANYS